MKGLTILVLCIFIEGVYTKPLIEKKSRCSNECQSLFSQCINSYGLDRQDEVFLCIQAGNICNKKCMDKTMRNKKTLMNLHRKILKIWKSST